MTNRQANYEGRDLEAMDFALNYHNWILDIFKPYMGEKIVEIGAGSGTFTELLVLQNPKKLVAVEPSNEMYSLLERTLRNNTKFKTETHHAFFKDICPIIKKEKPDSIIYINVFEHIEDDISELGLLYKTLPPGGRLCIFVPANTWLMSNFDRKIGHYRRYSKNELENKVKQAGFTIKVVNWFDFIGIFPWLVKFRLLGSESMEPGLTKLFDSLIVPVESYIEKRLKPPLGKNLILVAQKH